MVYLDYAATCPVVKYPQLQGYFLNPNANYAYMEKRLLSEAENIVKKAIGAKSGKVVFGGTSSQLVENLMMAVDEATNYRHMICSSFEHNSCFRYGQVIGYSKEDLFNKLQIAREYIVEAQTFVMWMGVNNITGEIFPVTEIGTACHRHDAFYICDATAMIGHATIPENIDKWCDAFIMDGHKLGTELGIGAMWISDNLDRWLNGFKLHGTPNLAGALALTQAVEDACDKDNLGKSITHFDKMQECLINCLVKNRIYFRLIPDDNTCPSEHEFTYAINAICLPGFNARALQSYLANKKIFIGLGQSSCADETDRRILCQGYGLSEQEADEVIRISFGEDSSVEDVEALIEGIVAFRKEYL